MLKEIGEAVTEIFKFLNNILITPRKQIQKVVRIYDAMHRILDETEIQRTLVFKVHNGGGLIKPNADLYVSVLYEDYEAPFKSVKEEYQKLQVDREYVKMILDIVEKKKIYYSTEDVPSSLVRNLYIKEGVKNSIVYFVGQDRKNMYFLSCATTHTDVSIKKVDQFVTIDLCANTIKQNIK